MRNRRSNLNSEKFLDTKYCLMNELVGRFLMPRFIKYHNFPGEAQDELDRYMNHHPKSNLSHPKCLKFMVNFAALP